LELMRSGQLVRELDHVRPIETAQESMSLNELPGPMMIIAGSGMCTSGRILHHLRHNLWRPETSVIFVGYQAEGSLGRRLVEGARQVNIFGETIGVCAQIATVNGFSGHAGQSELVQWFDSLAPSRPRLVITHGEEESRQALGSLLREKYDVPILLPTQDETIVLE
jgi:metallo-beta-lactamase family protein